MEYIPFCKKLCWLGSLKYQKTPQTDTVANITYMMDGTIASIEAHRITIKNGNNSEAFSTQLTRYTLVNSLDKPTDWPIKLVAQYVQDQFKVGDSVTLFISADRYAPIKKDQFYLSRVLKVTD
jgi:hypothetical protein